MTILRAKIIFKGTIKAVYYLQFKFYNLHFKKFYLYNHFTCGNV